MPSGSENQRRPLPSFARVAALNFPGVTQRHLPVGSAFLSCVPTAQPEWLTVISDTEADIGSNLQWGCAAAGKPRPTVRWLRNGEPLASQVGDSFSLPFTLAVQCPPAPCPFGQPPQA